MTITFYGAPFSSAVPVATALAELDVPHDKVVFDLSKRDHKHPDYLAINPNGTVPGMVVDGHPMFETVGILLWLGETYGVDKKLWPERNTPEWLQAYSWCTWAYVTYGSTIMLLAVAANPNYDSSLHSEVHAAYAKRRFSELLSLLEDRLSTQRYMLGAEYSLVDLVVASCVGYSTYLGADVSDKPHVKAWLQAFQERAAYLTATNTPLQASA